MARKRHSDAARRDRPGRCRAEHSVQIKPQMERLLQPGALSGAQPGGALLQPDQALPTCRDPIRKARFELPRHAQTRMHQNLDACL